MRQQRHLIGRVVSALVVLLVSAALPSTAGAIVFGLKSASPAGPPTHLFSFAEDGSAFTDIGSVTIDGSPIDADGLAISPTHGLLAFFISRGGDGSALIAIDPSTAAATVRGTFLAGRDIRGATFDLAGRLRVLDAASNELLEIDPATGTVVGTPVALTLGGSPFDLHNGTDIAVRANGTFYVVNHAPPATDLYTLDITTGALTLVFSDSAPQEGIAPFFPGITFSEEASSPSHLFGYEANGSDDIFRYDVDLGAASRTLLFAGIISGFNAGRGDLAASVASPGPADLVETVVSNPPAAVVLKGKFSVTDTVENGGGENAAASTTRYYLSLDTTKSAGDKLLSGNRLVPALGPGAQSTGTKTVTVPASTKLGSYFLLACADDKLVVTEDDETNNCIASATTVEVRAPDLVETAVSDPPASAAAGSSFSVTDTARNQGNANAGASTTRYYLSLDVKKSASDRLLTGERAVPALAVGADSTGTISVTVPPTTPAGTYFLLACADDLKKVAESNEKNNCRASATKVTVTP